MSTTGNRSNPNQTRLEGRQDGGGDRAHANASGKSEIGRQGGAGQGAGATHQETREHNKHNHAGQSGHKPQKHNPAEEKH
jgi:hypothetical protein